MGHDFDFKAGVREVLRVIGEARTIDGGMAELFSYCHRHTSDEAAVVRQLETINYGHDAKRIGEQLFDAIEGVPGDYTGLYFGLDGDNMVEGKGIEFGCSTAYEPGNILGDWPHQCDLYPAEIRSEALSTMYRSGVKAAGVADVMLCLGYTGLALRRAFEVTDPDTLLGNAKERAVTWGWHDGDLLVLGLVQPNGFSLRLDQGAWLRD